MESSGRIVGMKKLTQEQAIERFVAKHGDRYDYSLVEYCQQSIKVKIVCKVHGMFEQTPNAHTQGQGCPKCGSKKKSQDDFINESKRVHGNKYDYSKCNFINVDNRVTIICKRHGEFEQFASGHLAGAGCKKCDSDFKRKSAVKFAEESKSVHGDKYDYSKVVYKTNKDKVELICKEHGSFWQTPSDHLTGYGCPYCHGNKVYTTDDFITTAKEVHGSKYDYSKSIYTRSANKLTITCPEHGDFKQTPNSHLGGRGCSSCAKSGFRRDKDAWFYIIHAGDFCGFGVTNKLNQRMKTHDKNLTNAKVKYRVFGTVHGSGHLIGDLESAVKKAFKHSAINTGIDGFRHEAIRPESFIDLLNFVEEYAKENRPEGRSDET